MSAVSSSLSRTAASLTAYDADQVKAGTNAANSLSSAEENLIKSYTGSKSDLDKVRKDLDLPENGADGKPLTQDAIQTAARIVYDKMQRAFAALMQSFQAAHETVMKVINSLRAS